LYYIDGLIDWYLTHTLAVFQLFCYDRHDIAEILLKVALSTIKQTNKHILLGGIIAVFVVYIKSGF
jgi:hypothetical protein